MLREDDRYILSVSPEEIKDVKIVLTIVDGGSCLPALIQTPAIGDQSIFRLPPQAKRPSYFSQRTNLFSRHRVKGPQIVRPGSVNLGGWLARGFLGVNHAGASSVSARDGRVAFILADWTRRPTMFLENN